MKKLQLFLALLFATLGSVSPALNLVDSAYLGKIGKNWIKNGGAEQGKAGWATFADAAATTPADCTGGSPASTWTVTGTNPLAEAFSFLWTHSAANRQGEGVSYDFTIDRSEMGKQQQITLDYEVASGTFAAGVNPIGGATAVESDLEAFLYDKTNAAFIDLSNKRFLSSVSGKFTATYQAASNSQSYRFCLFNPTTTTTAHTVKVDSIKHSPVLAPYSPTITDWMTWTPTGSWVSNTTYTGKYRRVGGNLEAEVTVTLTGAPTSASLTVNLPTGLSIDTSQLSATGFSSDSSHPLFISSGYLRQHATAEAEGVAIYNSTTAVGFFAKSASGSNVAYVNINATSPWTWSSGDGIHLRFEVPILGWSSGNTASQGGDDTRSLVLSVNGVPSSTLTASTTALTWAAGSVTVDTMGNYSPSTGAYTVSVSDWYYIDTQMTIRPNSSVAGDEFDLMIYQNSTQAAYNNFRYFAPSGNYDREVHSTYLGFFKAGDTITPKEAYTNTSTPSFDGSANRHHLYIYRLGGGAKLTAQDTVAFLATRNTTQAISNSADTVILFDTKVYDRTGAFDTSTGKFQPGIPGIYHYTAECCYATNATNQRSCHVKKNGSYYRSYSIVAGSTAANACPINSGDVFLNGSTDYIQAVANQDSGGSLNIIAGLGSTGDATSFSAYRVGN